MGDAIAANIGIGIPATTAPAIAADDRWPSEHNKKHAE